MNMDDSSDDLERVEELTAYLDGELDEKALRRVEQRLKSDPTYLAEMQALQKTWDLLDFLPQSEPTTSFTKTTMEMVVQESSRATNVSSRLIPIFAILGAFLLPLAIGYAWLKSNQGHSDRILVDNLDTINYHEKYSAIDVNLNLLVEIDRKGLFSNALIGRILAGTDDANPSTFDEFHVEVFDPDIESRVAWIQSLTVRQKSKLKNRLDQFLSLDTSTQDELRRFGDQLRDHPNRDQLVQTLVRYYEWLKTLNDTQLLDLQRITPEKRILKIEQLLAIDAEQQFSNAAGTQLSIEGELLDEDASTKLFYWFRAWTFENEQAIRKHFPIAYNNHLSRIGSQPVSADQIAKVSRRIQLSDMAQNLIIIDRPFIESRVRNDDISLLLSALPERVERKMLSLNSAGQRAMVVDWLEGFMKASIVIPNQILQEFSHSLPEADRAALDPLPREERMRILKEMYYERALPQRIVNLEDVFGIDAPFSPK